MIFCLSHLNFLYLIQEVQQTVKEPYGLNLAKLPEEKDLLIYER